MQKSVQARKNRIISRMNGQSLMGLPIFRREKCKSPIRFSLQWLWRTVIMGIKENDKFEVMEE